MSIFRLSICLEYVLFFPLSVDALKNCRSALWGALGVLLMHVCMCECVACCLLLLLLLLLLLSLSLILVSTARRWHLQCRHMLCCRCRLFQLYRETSGQHPQGSLDRWQERLPFLGRAQTPPVARCSFRASKARGEAGVRPSGCEQWRNRSRGHRGPFDERFAIRAVRERRPSGGRSPAEPRFCSAWCCGFVFLRGPPLGRMVEYPNRHSELMRRAQQHMRSPYG